MEEDESIAACQSRVLLHSNPDLVNTEGNEINYIGFTWCRNYGKFNTDDDVVEDTLGLSVCSAIFRKKVFDKVGLFDEDFFMYLDDTDLGLRIYLKGLRVVCNTKSIVLHKYEYRPSKKKMYFLERNRLLVLLKTYDISFLIRIAPIFILVELGLLFLSVSQGWAKEKIDSYLWIVRHWRLVKCKRENVQRAKDNVRSIVRMMNPAITFEEIQSPLIDRLVNPILKTYFWLVVRP
jgi:GT2 family glycosyltransferase